MINGKLTDFVDSLYYGQEMVFMYQDVKYFVQGWWSDDKSTGYLKNHGDFLPQPSRKDFASDKESWGRKKEDDLLRIKNCGEYL